MNQVRSERLTTIAVNMLTTRPKAKLTAKPLTVPLPMTMRTNGRDHDRYVGVEDGIESPAETGFHRRPQALADEDFFLEPFKDKDVGIDGETHRQDNTGNPGKVSVASRYFKIPSRMRTYTKRAILATIPDIR